MNVLTTNHDSVSWLIRRLVLGGSQSCMLMRRTNPGQARPFRTPWVPLVPILGVISNGYMMYKLGWVNWARLIIWLAIGLVVYFSYGQKHSRVQALAAGKTPEA